MAATAIAGINLGDYTRTPQQKGWGAPCTAPRATVVLSQASVTVDARLAELVGLIMRECEARGYIFRKADTGAYNCRQIAGSTAWSWHSWAIAVDVNWQSNPFTTPLRTDIPVWMRQLWNRYGFAWGGDYSGKKDAMHFEAMGTPAEMQDALVLARRELGVGALRVDGAIAAAYKRPVLNGVPWDFFLGAPKGPEVPTKDGVGRWQEFAHGIILWHPQVDGGNAHIIWGDIQKKFWEVGAEGRCGYPLTDEISTPDTTGRFNDFAHPDGVLSIYWTAKTGAHLIQGAIRARWGTVGWEKGYGFPITDEVVCPDQKGRFTQFADAGAFKRYIYWSPATGAHPVKGAIFNAWAAQGYETGPLGYPTDEELPVAGKNQLVQTFEGGAILWDNATQRAEIKPK